MALRTSCGKRARGSILTGPRPPRPRLRPAVNLWAIVLCTLVVSGGLGLRADLTDAKPRKPAKDSGLGASPDPPTHSTTIGLNAAETRLVVVNREANSVSIIQVKDADGNDLAVKLAEIGVGQEPRCVAIHPSDRAAYVTNGISGTVAVVDLVLGRVAKIIKVGTEPRGCALTPDGSLLYVANHTEGTVSILAIPANPLNPVLARAGPRR